MVARGKVEAKLKHLRLFAGGVRRVGVIVFVVSILVCIHLLRLHLGSAVQVR